MTHTDAETTTPEAATAPEPIDATSQVRLLLLQDQLSSVAGKINLLSAMGLTETAGYREAYETYESRLADLTALKVRFGL